MRQIRMPWYTAPIVLLMCLALGPADWISGPDVARWPEDDPAWTIANPCTGDVRWWTETGGPIYTAPSGGRLGPGASATLTVGPGVAAPGIYDCTVTVTFWLVGDFDGDWQVSVLDVVDYVLRWPSAESLDDLDGDGACTVLDVAVLVSQFGAGRPEMMAEAGK